MSAEHWGGRPRDWAELAEPSNQPLFAEVLRGLGVRPGTELLDVGCGSGFAAQMAADLGASVTGLDITPELVVIARERVPAAIFVRGGMDALPFEDETFDAVVGFNAFPFADDPGKAVAEAARVVRSGGAVAATTFAEPDRNESTALHLALEPLRSPAAARHLPYALSEPGGLEQLLSSAGLEPDQSGEVPLVWAHDTSDEAVRAVLASGGGAIAIETSGEAAARDALTRAVAPFTRADGKVKMHNVFRYAIARRPSGVMRGSKSA
jgi:SAM-dependent methyltransferase